MKIKITFDLSEDAKVGIANHYNCDVEVNNPPADYETCKDWIKNAIHGEIENLHWYKEPEQWEIEEKEAQKL